jgi:hypothetical protein
MNFIKNLATAKTIGELFNIEIKQLTKKRLKRGLI